MRARPVATRVVQATPQQQLAQAMPTPLQIFPRIIPRARQVPHGLVFGRRRLDRRQQPRTPQFRQLARIAAIRLHPLARLPRNQRRRDHVTAHTRRRHLPLQRVATRPGLIEDADRPRRLALELPHQAPHCLGSFASCHVTGVFCVANQHRDEQILLVRVDAHVRSNLFHDRLPSMRLWRPRALTRDLVAPTTVLSAARHYNVTMASRSFHIV